MFIGHFGVGLGVKKYAPAVSLAVLFIAVQFLDLLWPTLLLLNIEHVVISPGITKVTPLDFIDYPISHSLLWVLIWAAIAGAFTWFILKNAKYVFILFCCVVSHWMLDFMMHRPDLPLAPGTGSKFGLGLWNYPVITAIAEGVFFLGGVWIYAVSTTAKNKFGTLGLILLVGLLIIIQIANMLGPPPPTVTAIAWAGQLQWLFVILAFYIDKNRSVKVYY